MQLKSVPGFHAKRAVTLEWLLRWTYSRQKTDVISGRLLNPGEAAADRWTPAPYLESGDGVAWVGRFAKIGCKIDGGRIRGVAEPLHPDAETVHEVVLGMGWAMAGMLVSFGRGAEPPQLPPEHRLHSIFRIFRP